MGAHTDSSVSRLEVVEVGRRRRWSDAEKLRIVAESMASRRLVSATARRHGISRLQLNMWRRLGREGRLVDDGDMVEAAAPTFAPVVVAADPPRPPTPGEDRVEILLANGRRVLVRVGVDAEDLIAWATEAASALGLRAAVVAEAAGLGAQGAASGWVRAG